MIERLENYTSKLKKLCTLKTIKKNSEKQESIDKQYNELLLTVHNTIQMLTYSHDTFAFPTAGNCISLEDLLSKLKNCISSGFADSDILSEAKADFRKIQASVKRDWETHYVLLTKNTLSTLQVISRLEPSRVASYQERIRAAATWPTNSALLMDLKTALNDAEKLIQSLNLDDTITVFLRKMASSQATILDLNPDVLNWIHSNALEGKIKLSFAAR